MIRMRYLLVCFLLMGQSVFSQVLHNPQQFYDGPEGLFDLDSFRTINIDFYDPNYHETLVNGWETQSGLRLPATITLSNGETLDSVAVRYKGNSTFAIANDNNNPKLPLNLDMNQMILGQELMDYKKVKLANSLFDPTFCKEVVAYDIYRKYLPSSQANFMKVNLEGNYLGLYVNTQSVDGQFLNQHFDENDGAFFKCDPAAQFGQPAAGHSNLEWLGEDTTLYYNHYTIKSDYGWAELVELIGAINSPLFPMDSILNVDRVLWAFAVNTVLLNLDTYNGLFQHNYYLYQSGDGLFQMIPWDLTETFVAALLNFNENIDELYEYDPYAGYNSWWKPLCYNLVGDGASALHRKVYNAHIRTVMEESLNISIIESKVDQLQNLVANAALSDMNQLFGSQQYYTNVDAPFIIPNVFATAGILPSIEARASYLSGLSELSGIPPTILNSDVSHIGDSAFVTSQVSNATQVELMVTTSPYNSKFKSFEMYDNGTNGDQNSGDGIFTRALPFQDGIAEVKYYIRTQNADAITLDPVRAEYEFYIYDRFVGLEEEVLLGFDVYPNPTSSSITIKAKGIDESSYVVTSILGEQLLSGRINSTKNSLDLSHLNAGVYLLQLGNKTVKVVRSAN